MRIGRAVWTMGNRVEACLEQARAAARDGYAAVWCPQIFGWDPLTLLAVVGREVPEIELGTAVVPVYPRHPIMLAAQALTTQALVGGRLTLGIGTSHRMLVTDFWGYSFDRPARYMREYLAALRPLLRGEVVTFEGEMIRSSQPLPMDTPGAAPPPVLLAALAPAMLRLAGSVADGTITWLTGPKTLAEHIAPTIQAAAREAGRPAPRIVAGVYFCVTRDVPLARERAAREFAPYGEIPSYRAVLDREGVATAADVAVIGDEEEVLRALRRFADAGATEILATVFGDAEEQARTSALLPRLAAEV